MATWELAQCNRARLAVPLDDPALVPFLAAIEGVDAEAEAAPGYRWRQHFLGPLTRPKIFPDDLLVTLSVWATFDDLKRFVYGGRHLEVYRQRASWFVPPDGPRHVLWWVPAGDRPDPLDAIERLDRVGTSAASPEAFTFATPISNPSLDD